MEPMPTVMELIAKASGFLARQGCEAHRLDAELLLGHVLECDRLRLYVDFERPVTRSEVDRYRQLVAARGRRVPTAQLTGTREFFSRLFYVNEDVLIPRPETELLVAAVGEELAVLPAPTMLDVGTGSGVVAISAALEHPHAHVTASDVSPAALAVAAKNSARWQTGVEFVESDLLENFPGRRFDFIVSNPPYIAQPEMEGLTPELRWEPALALDGGGDGLDVYRRLLQQAPVHLNDGGLVLLEIGREQAAAVAALAAAHGLAHRETRQDYAGHDRVVIFTWQQ